MREADGRPRRRRHQDQPARPGRAGHRPLRHRRRLRHAGRLRAQRRDRVRAQRASATSSCAGARAPSTTSRSCRPGTGIVHQVNIEHLARVVFTREVDGDAPCAYPDTCVGTDSHTTMVNGLGVVGWGVGGIEAEAAMLGQPVSHADPARGRLQALRRAARGLDRHRPGAHHHRDAAQARRGRQVRGVLRRRRRRAAAGQPRHHRQHEPGVRLDDRGLPDRRPRPSTTCGSPAAPTSSSRWSRPTPRSRASGTTRRAEPRYSERLELDLSTVVPSLAGPKRPQDRVEVTKAGESFAEGAARTTPTHADATAHGHASTARTVEIDHGAVAIAAITSCTNTSNPSVMIGAALLAKNAVEKGLSASRGSRPSLAPGSKVVTDYYERAGLTPYLDKLGFNLVGYGCTTCIGNSGPAHPRGQRRGQRGTTWRWSACCPATATSRAGSTPT